MLYVLWKQSGVGRVGMLPRRLLLNQIVPHHIEFDMGRDVHRKILSIGPFIIAAKRNQPLEQSFSYPTLVAIHHVVPPASFTPPRLSSSSFLTGSCTDVAPAASALL
jgi:hypothetical protein